jgi:hypothetical protein
MVTRSSRVYAFNNRCILIKDVLGLHQVYISTLYASGLCICELHICRGAC